ncbi:LPD38 domain-containing protein [Thauera sp.]|uniref:LPD38 domain-containing protein n=1 Tax=Thauera sp. TaxID=1905334 RepID=UPI002C915F2F|nr:LPD38 domain-containing protein [Thauera sp.]HRO35393.1 LPD5 domain-containing protein [Thauera sp.]
MALDLTYDPDWKPARPQGAADPAVALDLTYDPAWTPSKRNTGLASDLATDLKRGAQKLPGALTGLADIPVAALTGERYVSRAADALGEATGFQPGKWADAAADEYSPQRKAGAAAIERAWQHGSAGDIAGAYLRNPGNVAGLVAESIPSMLAGGLVGRAALAGAARLAPAAASAPIAPVVAGAAGEGAMIAGQTMESISDDVDPRRAAAAAAAAGLAGSALGVAGGAFARRLGVIDPETALAGGVAATGRAPMGLTRRLAGGATAEGLLQEMPQSVTEQALQNWAEEKPLGEGVARAAVEGTMAGGLIGAGANVMPVRGQQTPPPPAIDPTAGPLSKAARMAQQANASALAQQQQLADEEGGQIAGEDPRIAAAQQAKSLQARAQADALAAERARTAEQAAMQDAAADEIAGATGFEDQAETADFNRFVGQEAQDLTERRARAADNARLERAGVREEMRTARDQLTAEGAFEAEQRARDRQRYDAAAMPFERILPEDFDTLNPIRAGQGEVLDAERPPARGLPPPEQQGALPPPEDRGAGSLEYRPQPSKPLRATADGQVGTPQQFEELDATRAGRREQMRVARERARFVSADAEARAARTVPYTEQTAQREAERLSKARQESFTVVPHPVREDRFAAVPARSIAKVPQDAAEPAQRVAPRGQEGERTFAPETGTLGIPRAEMPQVPSRSHGGLVKHLNAQGIAHETTNVDAASLKPTQAEYSPEKVEAAKTAAGDRAVIVSNDGHIVDRHHQAMAAAEEGKQIKAIVLDAPIDQALEAVKNSPSAQAETSAVAERASAPTKSAAEPPKAGEGKEAGSGNVIDDLMAMEKGAGQGFKSNDRAIEVIRRATQGMDAQSKAKVSRTISKFTAVERDGTRLIKPGFYEAVAEDFAYVNYMLRDAMQDAPEFTTLKDRSGNSVTVRTADLSGARERMPMFTKDGKRKATWIHRDNLDPTGEKQSKSAKEMADNPLFNVITTKGGKAFAIKAAASRELNARGLAETHEVVPAGDVQAGMKGYVVRKKADVSTAQGQSESERQSSALPDFSVFYNDENGVMWGIPYAMRQGQQPKDIKPEFRGDWVRLSGAAWTGNRELMPAEQQAMSERLQPGEWVDVAQPAAAATEGDTQMAEGGTGATGDQDARQPEAFVSAPDGSIDFGEITPEMAQEMRRQEGKIRLQNGVQNANGTGWGLAHIEARHGREIRSAGFESVAAFISDAVSHVDAVWKPGATSQVVAVQAGNKGKVVFLELQASQDETGDFYRVNSAFPAPDNYVERKQRKEGWRRLWSRYPVSADASGASGFADQSPDAGETAPTVSPQSRFSVAPASQKAKAQEIADFGEKIGGARKDVWAGFQEKLSEVSDDDIANQPLSKSWPQPDYQALIDAGVDPWVAAFIRAARDEIPAKPRQSWKLKRWSDQVRELRSLAQSVMADVSLKGRARELFEKNQALVPVRGRVDLYMAVGHGKSLEGVRFGHRHYTLYKGRENVSIWVVEQATKATAFSNWPRELATGDTKEDALATFKAKYDSLNINEPAARQVSFDIYSKHGVDGYFIGKKIGRNHFDLAGPFKTVKEAREHKATQHEALLDRLEKVKEIPRERRDTNEPRVGEDMRNGQDVTPEMFSDAFGFRGVEFGNWVEQGRRQKDLNDAYDALMDMAAVLGIPPKAVSLNGELGLAFGARGSGGKGVAAAHYEPGKVVINLTKKEGAGSLGHEWWHALDNYFSRMRNSGGYMTDALDVSLADRGSDFVANTKVRHEMIEAFGEVMRAIRSTALKARSQKLDERRTKEYWTTKPEMSARAFESYLISRLQDHGASNDYLANIVSEKTWQAAEAMGFELDSSYPYPTAGEIPRIRAAFDSFFTTIQSKETDKGVMLFSRGEGGVGLTRDALRQSIVDRFPRLAKSIDAMLKRGDEGTRGGVVVVERARDLAGTFASKTGRTMEEALDLLQMSQGAQAAPASLAEVEALWDARGIDNAISEKNGIITLHKIIVQAGQRESGVGTQAMRELIAYADRTGQQIALTPSSDFGGNKRRLEGFYRRLGFRTYKGFAVREKRIRDPEVLQSQNGDIQGFFDPKSGLTFMVAPNLTAETAPAVLFHEAMHGKQREEIDRKALQMIENRGTRAKPLREFLLRVAQRMEDAGEFGNSAEAASYIVEQAVTEGRQAGFSAIDGKLLNWIDATIGKPVGDLVRGFVAMVRAWALRKGFNFEPSVDDLVAIARSNLQQMARGDATGGERVQASRLARSPSTITAAWESPEPSKLDSLIYTLQNKQVDMKRVVDAVKEQVGEIEDQWNPYLQEELFHGRSAKGVRDFLAHEMRPLLAEMRRSGVEMAELEKFLHSRHAPEANAHIAKINPNEPDLQDGGSGMTNKEAADHLASIAPDRRRTLDALAKQIDTINASTRKLMVDSGLETAETIKAWEAAYKNYVPLQREDVEAGGLGIGQGFSVRGPASKRRTGSKKAVIDVLANIALQREKTIVRAEKNRVAQANYALAIKAPNPDFWMPVNPDEAKAFTPAQQAKMASELVSMGLDPADAQNFVKEPVQRYVDPRTGLVAERINPVLRGADNVLALRIEGKDRFVFFNRKDDRAQRMVHALKNLDADQLGHVFGVLAKLTRFFAAVNTQWNPIFGVVNLTRDTQAALLQLSTTPIRGSEKAVLKNVLPAMRGIYAALRAEREGEALPNSPWAKAFDEFRNEGGQTGYRDMFSNSQERADALAKELNPEGWMDSPLGKVFTANGVLRVPMARAQRMAGGLFNWLTDYNDTLENAVRLSAYMEAKAKGLSSQEAASVAKNLTVNFNRKGQIATQAGALYAFFNAAMQGTTRMLQTLKGPAGRKIILGGLTLGALQAVTLAAAGFDDEEPPEFVRERSIVIPLGDGKYASIPMPLGFHVIPSTSRILTEWALSGFRDTTKRFGDFVALFADTFNPIGNAGWSMQTLAPTALDPVAALAENRDWTGKPIAQQDFNSLRPTPGYARARDTASELSKALAYWINLSTGGTDYKPGLISPTPDQIDYLIGQITGGVGREYLKAEQTATSLWTGEELPPHKIPLLGRFYGDATGQSSEATRFYNNLRDINLHRAEIEGRRKDGGDVQGYLQDNPAARIGMAGPIQVEGQVRKLREAKRIAVERGDAARVRAIDGQITTAMRRFNERVSAAAQ